MTEKKQNGVGTGIIAVAFTIMIFLSGGICLAKNLIDYESHYSAYDVSWTPLKRVVYCVRAGVAGVRDADDFPLKSKYIDFYGGLQRIAMKNTVQDADATKTVIRLKNDYLTFLIPETDFVPFAENLADLNEFAKSLDIPLVFTSSPYKIDANNPQLPRGIRDYSNRNLDSFFAAANAAGVDCIDMREVMLRQSLNSYDYFFRTDHHWTPHGAFLAFAETAQKLRDSYGLDFNEQVLNISNYKSTVCKENFMGTLGKRVGYLYATPDDFELLTPDFSTSFSVTRPQGLPRAGTVSGSFEDALLDTSLLNVGGVSTNSYGSYDIGGKTQIINRLCKNGKKILLVRDSFGCAFAPFLSLICSQVDSFDMRGQRDYSLKEYIVQTSPDYIVFCFNPSTFREVTFDFDSAVMTETAE